MLRPYNLKEVLIIPDSSHHGRRSIRLPGYDYAQPGAYFITICTVGKRCLFGSANDGRVDLTDCGAIIEECWLAIPRHFPLVQLDEHVVMPNHLHGVILISHERVDPCRGEAFAHQTDDYRQAGEQMLRPYTPTDRPSGTSPNSLGAIIQNFKSVTARKINKTESAHSGSVWQRNYYEHVIRDERSLDEIREYIAGNPWNWSRDEYHMP